jgi:hypothetical protein
MDTSLIKRIFLVFFLRITAVKSFFHGWFGNFTLAFSCQLIYLEFQLSLAHFDAQTHFF